MGLDAIDGYQLVDGPSTVRPVLGTFTEAPLSSLSDLLLTVPIRHKCLDALSSCINLLMTNVPAI